MIRTLSRRGRAPLLLAALGSGAALAAAGYDSSSAGAAAKQSWPAFALVVGLLLIGMVAADDGLFASAGHLLARSAKSGRLLFVGVAGLVVVVTAVLNLDTAVAFLTPVVVHTARRRGEDGVALLAACLLLSNAGSLLLPGSNLTNLIVLGHLHLTGSRFVSKMGLPWLVATVVTTTVVLLLRRGELAGRLTVADGAESPTLGLGLLAVVASIVIVLLVSSPALPVIGIGVVATVIRLSTGRVGAGRVLEVVGVPVLLGLFGMAVALGALGRDWAGPAHAMHHLDSWGTAGVAAVASVAFNNLPAASLLSARVPSHPFSLLIGLNLGPNLLPSGSLAWVLWARSARQSGARAPVWATVRLGLVAVPLCLAGSVGALLLTRLT